VPGPWRFRGPGDAEVSVKPAGPLSANSGEALMPALLAGLGIARLPGFVLGDALPDGRVVELLAEWRPAPIGLHLLTPPSTLRPARVESLIAFLEQRLRD
jgi:DNA-binding transcriptional LysR family regulator